MVMEGAQTEGLADAQSEGEPCAEPSDSEAIAQEGCCSTCSAVPAGRRLAQRNLERRALPPGAVLRPELQVKISRKPRVVASLAGARFGLRREALVQDANVHSRCCPVTFSEFR